MNSRSRNPYACAAFYRQNGDTGSLLRVCVMLYETIILEEIAFSEKIVRAGHDVIPRFRILSHEGEFCVLLPLPSEEENRLKALRLIATFMALKLAVAFILACELAGPEALMALAVHRQGAGGYILPFSRREPLSFGPRQPADPALAGAEILALLPAKETVLTGDQLRELEDAMRAGHFLQVMQTGGG
jgi:hypothetical protein